LSAGASILAFAAQPFVAAVLGIVLGAALLMLTAAGVRQFTPETLEIGMARALVLMLLGLVLALAALFLYYRLMPAGLVPFGLGLVAGFIVPAFVALFRVSGITKSSTARR
jgi:uncharacterized membrane protein YedE/YeeE